MKQICVVGVGYVVWSPQPVLLTLGNRVIALDISQKKSRV
jgi:UDP-glucose 6-dehydrogenase